MTNQIIFTKGALKKASSLANSFDNNLETFKLLIEPACETSFRDVDDIGFLQFRKSHY